MAKFDPVETVIELADKAMRTADGLAQYPRLSEVCRRGRG